MATDASPSRREFFLSLSARARAMLLVAIFLLFSSLVLLPGFAGLYPSRPWWVWLVMAVFGGWIAVGFAMSSMWTPRLLAVVIPAAALFPPVFFIWLYDMSGLNPPKPVFRAGALTAAVSCMLLIIGAYIIFVLFIQGEVTRRIRLSAELRLAQQIHASLVPPIDARIERPGGAGPLEVCGVSRASSEMGGDLIDMVRHADGSVDVFLADVSGHGVSAGVVMGMVKSVIRTRLLRPAPLGELVADLNAVLESLTEPHMFATLACLRLHADGRVESLLAGHPPVIHIVAATGEARELANESLPLGIATDETFVPREFRPAPGDLLLLYTDGLTEAADAGGRQFGVEGVRRAALALCSQPIAAIASGTLAASLAHGPQTDDQSVLIVRV